ncbi:MAG: DUF2865 domain-containing protein [Pseudomonadota bacterium]
MNRFAKTHDALGGAIWKPALCAMALFFVTPAFLVEDAFGQANSRVCKNLKAQLASVQRSGGNQNSKKARQYDAAIRKQGIQINKAVRAARRGGCVGAGKNRNNRCKQITSSLAKMQANLRQLKQTNAQIRSGGSGNINLRNRILGEMSRNRCDQKAAVRTASKQQNKPQKKSKRRTLLEQVFGVRTYDNRGKRRSLQNQLAPRLNRRSGTFRTLCVRKSDGYYFPISFSTVPDRFNVDEQICQNMCPGSDVGLYYHRMPSEDSEDMVAYGTEIPYVEEPFAFDYRRKHNPNLTCRFSMAGLQQIAGEGIFEENTVTKKEVTHIGAPSFRTDPTQVPDAFDNVITDLSFEAMKDFLDQANSKEVTIADRDLDQQKKIRIVGPAFFPVQ